MHFRVVSAFLFLFLVSQGQALPAFLETLKKQYPNNTAISKAGCQSCHTSPPKFNSYGEAVHEAFEVNEKLDATALLSIEAKDSDGDGVSNGDELKKDALPGDPKSKPKEEAQSNPTTTKSAETESEENPIVKQLTAKHSFHPAVSHFPLALIVISALFAFLAKKKNSESLQSASVYNLLAGLILGVVTVITGLLAMFRMEYAIQGTVLLHLITTLVSLSIAFVAYIKRREPSYLGILVLAGIVILVAGHFGGVLVHG